MTAFDSAAFFTDEFFLPDTITLGGGLPVKGILIDGLDPERHGALAGRPGHWGRLYLLTANTPVTCQPGTEFGVNGEVWRKDSSSEQGDVTEIVVWTEQRKR